MLLGWKTCQCTTAILSSAFWSLRAMEEGWPLLSADPLLARYPAELIW
jgi:hypothetical protein